MNKVREEMVDYFIKMINDKPLDWMKDWTSISPSNAMTTNEYHGINRFILEMVASERGYKDPRWATFKQVMKMGYSLKDAKGMGVKIEYFFPMDKETYKSITWGEYYSLNKLEKEDYVIRSHSAVVFNASHIEGIPEISSKLNDDEKVISDSLLEELADALEIDVQEGGNHAAYIPSLDMIVLPPKENFSSWENFSTTALHEFCHCTGAETRLGRDLSGMMGSKKYAMEELRAELASCFLTRSFNIQQTEEHMVNHAAYIQSWSEHIKENPDLLVGIIKDAEEIANYIEFKAGKMSMERYQELFGNYCSIKVVKDVKLGDEVAFFCDETHKKIQGKVVDLNHSKQTLTITPTNPLQSGLITRKFDNISDFTKIENNNIAIPSRVNKI